MTALASVTRWLAVNAVLTVATAVLAYVLVAVAGDLGLRAGGVDPLSVGDYLLVLFSSAALMWPFYMAALAAASRGHRRFRLWALVLCPLLGLLWFVGNLALTVPEIQAADLFYLAYALVVRPLPSRTRAPDPGPAALGARRQDS